MKFDRRVIVQINMDTAGNHTIITAPGEGKSIEIDHLDFLCSGGANTVKFTIKSSTDMARYSLDDAQGYQWDFNTPDRNCIALDFNTPFVMNNNTGGQVEGLVLARIVGD